MTYTFGAGDGDVYLIKTDSSGYLIWSYTYDKSLNDNGIFVTQTSDGGYIIVNYTNTLIKTEALGDTLWTRTYDDFVCITAASITNDGGYIIIGYYNVCDTFGVNYDILAMKIDSLGNVDWISEGPLKPYNFTLSAHPNPFNSAVTITAPAGAEVEVFDVNGRRVKIIPPGPPFTRGEEEDKSPLLRGDLGGLVWQPAASLGSGVYLVRARFEGGETATKRMVYLK